MNDEDRKYLERTEKVRPSSEIFNKMVQILKVEQEEIERLLTVADTHLLKTYKTLL
jgi:hypothetical protein